MKTLIALLALAAAPAYAHHPMGGETPRTLFDGLASGLAHPVIGFDHLAFIVLVGLAAATQLKRVAGPAVFVGATLLGTFLQLAGFALPLVELAIAGSVVVLGGLLLAGRRVSGGPALAGFALAGLFHGWAYGAAVIGAQTTAIGAYLLGFGAIQFAIAFGVAWLASRAASATDGPGLRPRLAAAVCFGVGLAFFLEHVEGLVFA